MSDGRVSAHVSAPGMSDALPYYDTEIDTVDGLRAAVVREIESEKGRSQHVLHDFLPPAYELSPALAQELARAEHDEKMNVLDTVRYQLLEPEDPTSEDAWEAALNNAETQLAYMDGRYVVFSLTPG